MLMNIPPRPTMIVKNQGNSIFSARQNIPTEANKNKNAFKNITFGIWCLLQNKFHKRYMAVIVSTVIPIKKIISWSILESNNGCLSYFFPGILISF